MSEAHVENNKSKLLVEAIANGTVIDHIIAEKQKLLVELEMHKKSMIFEYVTGKKEAPVCR